MVQIFFLLLKNKEKLFIRKTFVLEHQLWFTYSALLRLCNILNLKAYEELYNNLQIDTRSLIVR